MLEFIATHSLWIALIFILIVMLWEQHTGANHFKKRLPEVAIQAAGVFFAVALAFEQTNYDRRQQRLSDAQTLALASSLAIAVGLEDLARVISIDYDAVSVPSWFAIPSVVEKMSTDEKVLATMSADNVRNLNRSIADLRRAPEEASLYISKPGIEASLIGKKSWKYRTCNLDLIVASHLMAINGIMAETCSFLKTTGYPLPAYLIKSNITPRNSEKPVFSINLCMIHAVDNQWGHHRIIESRMAGNPEDCNEF